MGRKERKGERSQAVLLEGRIRDPPIHVRKASLIQIQGKVLNPERGGNPVFSGSSGTGADPKSRSSPPFRLRFSRKSLWLGKECRWEPQCETA